MRTDKEIDMLNTVFKLFETLVVSTLGERGNYWLNFIIKNVFASMVLSIGVIIFATILGNSNDFLYFIPIILISHIGIFFWIKKYRNNSLREIPFYLWICLIVGCATSFFLSIGFSLKQYYASFLSGEMLWWILPLLFGGPIIAATYLIYCSVSNKKTD